MVIKESGENGAEYRLMKFIVESKNSSFDCQTMSRISFIFVRYQVSERVIMDIKSFQYNNITEIDKQLLKSLLYFIWEDINIEDIHPQEMNVMSFCAIEKNEFIGYLGVVSWNIIVKIKLLKCVG